MIKLNGKEITKIKFPNNETSIDIDTSQIDWNKTIIIDFYFQNNDTIFDLLLLNDIITRHKKQSKKSAIVCHLHYVPYSRMDRVDKNVDNPFSLKVFIDLLPTNWLYTIDEAHSDVTLHLMKERNLKVSENKTTLELLNDYLNDLTDLNDLTLIFPDKGAYTRYMVNSLHHPTMERINKSPAQVLIGEKVRNFKTGRIKSVTLHTESGKVAEKDDPAFKNKQVIVIDDLTSFGTTFVKTIEAYKKFGPKDTTATLIVTHIELHSAIAGALSKHFNQVIAKRTMDYSKDGINTPTPDWLEFR